MTPGVGSFWAPALRAETFRSNTSKIFLIFPPDIFLSTELFTEVKYFVAQIVSCGTVPLRATEPAAPST